MENCQPTRHEVYYWETVIFQVEQCLFKVPRLRFVEESDVFKDMFTLPSPEDGAEGDDDSRPIKLLDPELTSADFESFLRVLYPLRREGKPLHLDESQWISVLKLSTKWECRSIRNRATKELTPRLKDAIQRLHIGRQYGVVSWMESAYEALIEREAMISVEEAKEIGYESSIRLMRLREEVRGKMASQAGSYSGYHHQDHDSRNRDLLLAIREAFKDEF